MDAARRTGLTASQPPIAGRIAGAVLAALRDDVGLTQNALAELMTVTRDAVQGWESGRRPLIHLQYTQLGKLRRTLQLARVTNAQLAVLDEALSADTILAEIGTPEPERHPLALLVPNRLLTELLLWVFSGQPPRQLNMAQARLKVGSGERDELASLLRQATDRARGQQLTGAMLRRQTHYLVAQHPGSAGWLSDSLADEIRTSADIREWSPEWAVTRSRAISAASRGNPEQLERFCAQGLATEQTTGANLRYWAYWVGELPLWSSDADMLTEHQPWSGELLLDSLLDGLEHAPYRDLCAHSLHTLLQYRHQLTNHPHYRQRLAEVLTRVISADDLAVDARRKLEQVAYAIGA